GGEAGYPVAYHDLLPLFDPDAKCRRSRAAASVDERGSSAGRSQRTRLAFPRGRGEPRRLDKNDNAWGSSHMPAYFALAASVGLLAVLDTWLFFGPLEATLVAGLVWVSFIAWGCHFHSGGGVKGMTTAIVCMSFGALIGMLSVMFANNVLGGLDVPVALGIAVGLGAATICLASKIPLLATIPASVYGFASIAGPMVLRGDAPEAAILPTIGAIVIGAVFG